MIAFLIAVAAISGGSALDAERAFARDAQRSGQWTAFRKWSDGDAVMFVPQAEWAREYLRGRKDPPRALVWRPAESITSCDGQVAVNQGPWTALDGNGSGTFTTIWMKKRQGWRWIYDGGDPRAPTMTASAAPKVRRASCTGRPRGAPILPAPKVAPVGRNPADIGRGESGDRTLGWDWKVGKGGQRSFRVFQWNGRAYEQVIDQHVSG